MNADAWVEKNKSRLGSDYERLFVEKVLKLVEEFDFSALHAQFPFTDTDGKNRYCDFVLIEGSDVRIAIEIDGYDKTGSGIGMSKVEFVDWQRRQAALTSQGWFVLRFANTDVRDHPRRCRDYIELLLRNERSKRDHQQNLRNDISKLNEELISISKLADEASTNSERLRLEFEIKNSEKQLQIAKDSKPLDSEQKEILKKFQHAQNTIQELQGENKTMNTTIWAFAVIISVLILTFGYTIRGNFSAETFVDAPLSENINRLTTDVGLESGAVQSDPIQTSPQNKGQSCFNPFDWNSASLYLGETAAFAGPVVRKTYREDISGQPTWIEIGVGFPNPDRVTLVIWGNTRNAFLTILQDISEGHHLCFTGKVEEFRGTSQVELRHPSQLEILKD